MYTHISIPQNTPLSSGHGIKSTTATLQAFFACLVAVCVYAVKAAWTTRCVIMGNAPVHVLLHEPGLPRGERGVWGETPRFWVFGFNHNM
jgi:hypothetical protein